MNTQKRILFVGESASMAHMGRPLTLARWAKEAGYDVEFACGNSFAHFPTQEGFSPHELPEINRADVADRIEKGQFFYTKKELTQFVTTEIDMLSRRRPDLVVSDFRLSLPIASAVVGIPCLSIANAYWSPNSPLKLQAPNSGLFGRLSPFFRRALFAPIRPWAFRFFGNPVLNQVRRAFGLRSLTHFPCHITAGNWCGYLDLPALFPVKPLPKNHFFIGPLSWIPNNHVIPSLNFAQPKRPLAYVTLGGSGDPRILIPVLKSLLARNFNILLSGIPKKELNSLKRAQLLPRDSVRSEQILDPRAALATATLTICHGGSGTVYQSLAAGVPILCLPGNPDQAFVADAVARAHAGRTIPCESASRSAIDSALKQLLDSVQGQNVREHAEALQRSLGAWNTRTRWLQFLENNFPLLDASPFRRSTATLAPTL